MRKILSKIFGLDRKENRDPVEQTPRTPQPSTDPPPQPLTPARDGLNLQNAAVSIPSPACPPQRRAAAGGEGQAERPDQIGSEGGLSAHTCNFRKPPSEKSSEGTQPILNAGRSSQSNKPDSTRDTYQKTKSAGIGCGPSDFRNPATNREPRGKVAHLPPAIRHQVCEWISDGVTLEQIAKNLGDLGHPGFNHKNISNWKENGYRTWCQHQQRHERALLRAEDTMSFATEHRYSDALVAAAEIDASNALEDANLAYDPNADHDSQLKQTRIILNRTRSFTHLNSQRQRSRKLTFQEQCHRDKLEASKKPLPETTAPATDEHHRKAFLEAMDKCLGIKTPHDQRTGAPAAAPPSTTRPEADRQNTPAKLCKTTQPIRESHPPSSDLPIGPSGPILPSSNPDPEPSGSLWKVPAAPQPPQVTPQPAYEEDWERLLTEPMATPNFIPQPEPLPRPYTPEAKPLKELPVPSLTCAYPPAPLTQPENKLALCNYNGVVTAWVGKSEDPSKTEPWIQAIKNHNTGQIICWFDFHSRPPGMTDADAVRGKPHFIPVFDPVGWIINWVPEPNGKHKRPPTLTAIPLEADHPRTHFAWLEPSV